MARVYAMTTLWCRPRRWSFPTHQSNECQEMVEGDGARSGNTVWVGKDGPDVRGAPRGRTFLYSSRSSPSKVRRTRRLEFFVYGYEAVATIVTDASPI